jgi:hypothetical protein
VEERDRQAAREVDCPNCGASNPAGAVYCSACGSRLPAPGADESETLIDVSSGEPRVLVEEQPSGAGPFGGGIQGGFTTVRFEQGRVFVSQGNRRNCLIVAVVALLLVCCACWFLWSIPARLF